MDIIGQIGTPAVLEQLAEECAELGQAALKMARKLRGENPTPKTLEECEADLCEEMGDVTLCLDLLCDAGVVDMKSMLNGAYGKQARWITRLNEMNKE